MRAHFMIKLVYKNLKEELRKVNLRSSNWPNCTQKSGVLVNSRFKNNSNNNFWTKFGNSSHSELSELEMLLPQKLAPFSPT